MIVRNIKNKNNCAAQYKKADFSIIPPVHFAEQTIFAVHVFAINPSLPFSLISSFICLTKNSDSYQVT